MSEHAGSFPPFVIVEPYTRRRPDKQESLRAWLRRQAACYGWRTRVLFVLAVATAALFWRVAGVWQPTVIATAPNGITFAPDAGENSTATLSADERLLAAWTGQAISIYDRGSRQTVLNIPYAWKIQSLSFSRDGRSLLTQDQQLHLRLFDAATGALRFELQDGAWPDLRSASLSPDGSRLGIVGMGEHGSHGALWDCTNRKKLMSDQRGFLRGSSAFTPDGKILAAVAFDGGLCVRRWNAVDGTVASNVIMPETDPAKYPVLDGNSLIFSPDLSTAAYFEYVASDAFQVHVIDAKTGAERIKPVKIAEGQYGPQLQYTPDGKGLHVLMCGYFIDVTTGKSASRSPAGLAAYYSDSPDSRWVACTGAVPYHTILLDSHTLQTVADLPGQVRPGISPFSPDSRRLVIQEANTGDYAIYDTATWKRISALPADNINNTPTLLADGSILSVRNNNTLVSWTHHRPDAWWGIAALWQFWLALFSAAAFVVSAARDGRRGYH